MSQNEVSSVHRPENDELESGISTYPTVVGSNIGQNVFQQGRKIYKTSSGFKFCLTQGNQDNRFYSHQRKADNTCGIHNQARSNIEQNVFQQGRKINRTSSGFKFCLTHGNQDNRFYAHQRNADNTYGIHNQARSSARSNLSESRYLPSHKTFHNKEDQRSRNENFNNKPSCQISSNDHNILPGDNIHRPIPPESIVLEPCMEATTLLYTRIPIEAPSQTNFWTGSIGHRDNIHTTGPSESSVRNPGPHATTLLYSRTIPEASDLSTGQFGGPYLFGQQIPHNQTGGVQCPQSVSCMPAPWCRRTVDSNGCPKCTCSMGQSSIMNPMAAMFHQMGGTGFNSLTGPTGIGTGALPNTNQPVPSPKTSCDQAPYTCSLPPPWCQRIVNSDGCVVCYCGQALQTYLKEAANGQSAKSTSNPTIISSVSKSTLQPSAKAATTRASTTATTTSCLDNFFCTRTCDNGYMTDVSGCPLCECIKPGCSGVITTKVPYVRTTTVTPIVTTGSNDGTVICPGIFDCTLMCMSGYQIDGQGCPLCKCLSGSQT